MLATVGFLLCINSDAPIVPNPNAPKYRMVCEILVTPFDTLHDCLLGSQVVEGLMWHHKGVCRQNEPPKKGKR